MHIERLRYMPFRERPNNFGCFVGGRVSEKYPEFALKNSLARSFLGDFERVPISFGIYSRFGRQRVE